ncbi:hypothetical protein FWK35_00008956, partial [Aphis craccivora]
THQNDLTIFQYRLVITRAGILMQIHLFSSIFYNLFIKCTKTVAIDKIFSENWRRSTVRARTFRLNYRHSERSDECIDFTMCVFLDSERSEECIDFTMIFQKNREKQKKNDGKTGIFKQNQFSTKSIFFMVVIQKLITENT